MLTLICPAHITLYVKDPVCSYVCTVGRRHPMRCVALRLCMILKVCDYVSMCEYVSTIQYEMSL